MIEGETLIRRVPKQNDGLKQLFIDLYWEQQSDITILNRKGILPLLSNYPRWCSVLLSSWSRESSDRSRLGARKRNLRVDNPFFFLCNFTNHCFTSWWVLWLNEAAEPWQSMISTKAYYWVDASEEYLKSVMMFMYADRQKQIHNWLVHIMNVRKKIKNANMPARPFLLFFWEIDFCFGKWGHCMSGDEDGHPNTVKRCSREQNRSTIWIMNRMQ